MITPAKRLLARDMPYSASFILDLTSDVDERIRHIVDFTFLPGFTSPTIAILFQHPQTWTRYVAVGLLLGSMRLAELFHSRLREYKDTVGMFIFTLDLVTRNCPIITAVENLPYDSLYLVPCSAALGGVVVVTSNSLIHIAQTSRRVVLPVNGWSSRVSDIPALALSAEESQRSLKLEGSRAAFIGDNSLFLFLIDGTVYPIEILAEGRTVSQLSMAAPVAQTTIPAVVKSVGGRTSFGWKHPRSISLAEDDEGGRRDLSGRRSHG